ncbi:glycosyltransferase 87 family protein [Embleya sp. NPDC127516]|uniref:glycosyltransferase 87 family protein n=1 Tax=Embleya sp. NPDC127516 TaxID=3363990 RepID=UPI0037F29AE6
MAACQSGFAHPPSGPGPAPGDVAQAVFIVYLLRTGRRRVGVTAITTAGATVALSALVLPGAARRFRTDRVVTPERVGRVENAANQSVRGLPTRVTGLFDPGIGGTLTIVIVGVLGTLCAVVAHRCRRLRAVAFVL